RRRRDLGEKKIREGQAPGVARPAAGRAGLRGRTIELLPKQAVRRARNIYSAERLEPVEKPSARPYDGGLGDVPRQADARRYIAVVDMLGTRVSRQQGRIRICFD